MSLPGGTIYQPAESAPKDLWTRPSLTKVGAGEVTELPQKIKAAMAAWRAYLEGLVVLVQHKRDEGEYEYIAIRS
jgi:hypothetical protein